MKRASRRCAAGGLLAATFLTVCAVPAGAEGVIKQFQGGGEAQAGFIPSDMGGAVGNGYVMQTVNGIVSTYNSNTGGLLNRVTLDQFWGNLGVQTNPSAGNFMSDPRVIFDPSSNRWFTSAITTAAVNQVAVAVSKGANPLGGFTGLTFNAQPGQFYDYPTLGVNHAAVTIGTNNFGAASGNFDGSGLFSIPKTDLTGGKPTLARITRYDNLPISDFTNEGVTNANGGGNSTTVLTSINSNSIAGFYGVQALKLSNANTGTATLSTGASYLNPLDVNGLNNPVQPSGAPYDPGDPRISSGPVQVGNLIYYTNSVLNGTSDQVYWGVINSSNQQLVRSGLIGLPGLDLTYPSIAANSNGTFMVAFNGSGTHTNISAYGVVCSEYTGACGSPSELYPGAGSNYIGNPNNPRWGDYSWITNDPYNANDFWLFQDYVTKNNLWGTVITEYNVSEPGSLLLLASGLIGLVIVRRKARFR
jgi:hypothetical protein